MPPLLLAVVRLLLPYWTSKDLVLLDLTMMRRKLHSRQQQRVEKKAMGQIADLLASRCSECTLDLSPG
jgi:hypothetical protein